MYIQRNKRKGNLIIRILGEGGYNLDLLDIPWRIMADNPVLFECVQARFFAE